MAKPRMGHTEPGPVLAPPVEGISGVWKFAREPRGYARARSLPGHLLHLVLAGEYDLRTNAREYAVRAGDVIYYHETEEVEWLGNRSRVVFYSVGFLAPELAPLAPDRRVFRAARAVRAAFEKLYAASLLAEGAQRSLRLQAALLEVLVRIEWWRGRRRGAGGGGEAWWALEGAVRERRLFRPTLDELAGLGHMSRASAVRACRRATGTSPMRRLQAVRMEEARGLLRFSALNVTQIARYLGYPRLHEFSREFSKYFGRPPSELRARWARTRALKPLTGSVDTNYEKEPGAIRPPDRKELTCG